MYHGSFLLGKAQFYQGKFELADTSMGRAEELLQTLEGDVQKQQARNVNLYISKIILELNRNKR